jgi:hypothetical protein
MGHIEIFRPSIDALPAAGDLEPTDLIAVSQSGAEKKATLSELFEVSYGDLIPYRFSGAVDDDGEISLPTAVSGFGFVQAGDNEEWIQFCFAAGGVVLVIGNSAHAVNTDLDGNLCVYDAGSGIAVKNRLGATKTIRVVISYSA